MKSELKRNKKGYFVSDNVDFIIIKKPRPKN